MPLVPVAMSPTLSTLPFGAPGTILLSDHTSHAGGACAKAKRGKSAVKKISAEMAGNLLIWRGQLNRTNRHCQAGFHARQSRHEKAAAGARRKASKRFPSCAFASWREAIIRFPRSF
jgi:hypothetical protein